VVLLGKHNDDFAPTATERSRLTRNGMGTVYILIQQYYIYIIYYIIIYTVLYVDLSQQAGPGLTTNGRVRPILISSQNAISD